MIKMKGKREMFKKSPEELQEYLQFRRRGSRIESKKMYSRKQKHKKPWD
jgi:hypothetical protein